jgi:predicted acyltransferase
LPERLPSAFFAIGEKANSWYSFIIHFIHLTLEPDPPATEAANLSQRLVSLDALRGFDMLWIMGGDSIGRAFSHLQGADSGVMHTFAKQLHHVSWQGFQFYDLIFPLFVFIVGVSLVFSLSKVIDRDGKTAATKRLITRSVLLWFIGVLYYGGWSEGVDHIRLLGVLQRIALAYLFAGLCFVYLKPRGQVIACGAILIGYWALLTFIPMPGLDQVSFAEGQNLTNWVDARYLPFFKWNGDHDPEGLLSTLPAVASCLLGVFAGMLLRDSRVPNPRKALWLFAVGIAAVILGNFWGLQFPIIKKLWTSSYVLVAGGWSAMLLATFYWIIDVKGLSKWAMPFVWIGMNPITIYLLGNVIKFDQVAARVLGGPVSKWLDTLAVGLGAVAISVAGILLAVGICWFLHRRKLFLRL